MAARLLLVVVLALGVFVMHTVGHPGEGSGTASPSHTVAHAAAVAGGPVTHGQHGDAAADAARVHSAVAAELTAGPAPTRATAPPDEPGTAMDMASLCLAVLGTWALGALLHAAFAGRRDWFARLATRALVLVRPNAPPRAPDLAQLSILRI
ncbi:hypothetical protein [Streptomyces formicae]|uniref:hypothetical protein n=1 Tax=Streptomyces formicae TaxID=1616117 RepID=UPI001F59128A|nr:hypothetical protein [Streptomyces formicae]